MKSVLRAVHFGCFPVCSSARIPPPGFNNKQRSAVVAASLTKSASKVERVKQRGCLVSQSIQAIWPLLLYTLTSSPFCDVTDKGTHG